jgi:hypothetical protein
VLTTSQEVIEEKQESAPGRLYVEKEGMRPEVQFEHGLPKDENSNKIQYFHLRWSWVSPVGVPTCNILDDVFEELFIAEYLLSLSKSSLLYEI